MLTIFRSFLQVVRTGSIRAASEASGQAPSSVSRQIHILEQQMGTALVVRTPSGAVPTAAGELLADFVNNVIIEYDRLRSDLNDLRGPGIARIRIGIVESMASGEVLGMIAAVRERQPNALFTIDVLPAPEIVAAVRQGGCDIGIALDVAPSPDLRIIGRLPERMVAACHADHDLASRPSLQLADLCDIPVALHEPDHGLRQVIDRACRMQAIALAPVTSSNSLEVLRGVARLGAAVALVTERGVAADIAQGCIVAVPIVDSALAFEGLTLFASNVRRPSRLMRGCEEELMRRLAAPVTTPAR